MGVRVGVGGGAGQKRVLLRDNAGRVSGAAFVRHEMEQPDE